MSKLVEIIRVVGRRISRERGTSLLEAVVAIALVAVIGVGYLTATSTGLVGAGIIEERSIAENLARNQLEEIYDLPYSDVYAASVTTPIEYEITIEVVDLSPPELPDTIQKVIVSVNRNGQGVLTLEKYKAKL